MYKDIKSCSDRRAALRGRLDIFPPYVINSILSVFSLSGCPRAKKSGIKTSPTKDNQEDSELLKFVPLRKAIMPAFSTTYGKSKKIKSAINKSNRDISHES